ncbi:MAG: PQQ-like beta-propeller repeat protein [Anaerolineales bacterium]|nr:PQQ-like beta-propeller repeat protein [Anaerolineales bacterium]
MIKFQDGQPLVIEAPDTGSPPAAAATFGVSEAGPTGGAVRPAAARTSCLVWLIVAVVGLGVGAPLLLSALGLASWGALVGLVTGGGVPLTQVPGFQDVVTQVPGLSEALTQIPAATNRYVVSRAAALVPAVSDAPADIVALVTQYPLNGGDGEQRLVALSGAEPKLLWVSDPLDKDTYDTPIVASQDFVYAVSGARLLALRRADGQLAWTLPLADKLSTNLCGGCLTLAGDTLYALTEDGTLQALEARTGDLLWKYAANEDSPRGLYLLAGRPAFMDRDDDGHGVLRVFDPATGEMQTAQPACPTDFNTPDYADWTTPVFLDPEGTSAYIVFGFFRTCIVRLDAATLAENWRVTLPDDFRAFGLDIRPVFTADMLYFSSGAQIVGVAAADGALTTPVADEDYTFVPLTVSDNTLLLRARRQRGSQRYELWAVDQASGERLWTFDLGEQPPLDPPDANTSIIDEDQPVWTWHATSAGVQLLRFKRAADDKSHAILLETLDWRRGASTGTTEVRLGIETIILSAPQPLGWKGGGLWMVIENSVLALDAARGEIFYRWP